MQVLNKRNILTILILATTLPFFALFRGIDAQNTTAFWLTAGSVFGFIGVVMLYWQLMLGSRLIVSKFSSDTIWFNKVHQNIGKYGMLFVLLHPFIKSFVYSGSAFALVFIVDLNNPFSMQLAYGRIAFFLFLIIWLTSAFFRTKLGYRTWVYIHYLAYPIILFSLLHAAQMGTYLNSIAWLATLWSLITYAFIFIVLYRIAKFAGLGSYKYELIAKEKVDDNIYLYTFKAKSKHLSPMAGQYCYIQPKAFSESHPFTIMETDKSNNTLKFGIKAQGKFTKNLSNLELGSTINIDGPYGVFTQEGHNLEPKVIIAGGIGVTPFVDLIKNHSNESTYMLYANRTLDSAVKRDEFKKQLGDRYYDVISDDKAEGQNIISGRLNENIIKEIIPENVFNEAKFFICGSKGFYENYKKLLMGMSIPNERIYYEEFGL